MTAAPPIRAKVAADLRLLFEGWPDPVAVGTGFDGAIYAVSQRSDESRRDATGMFAKSQLTGPTDYLVVSVRDEVVRSCVVRDEALVVSFVQPVAGGVLLVGARCAWRTDGVERNALAVDWAGREIARFTLGDGIADVRVTSRGTIWVSYFDEGVFGNHGWGSPGTPPVGRSGLVAFSPAGEVCWIYDPRAAGTDDVCDAYALNVAVDGAAWLYFYTEFPIVRVHDGAYRTWKLGVAGARALAVRDDRVLLFGDYGGRNVARIVGMSPAGTAEVLASTTVVGLDGKPIGAVRTWGVDASLFFLDGCRVLVANEW